MSDFEKWFRSLNANGKTVYFLGNEHKVSEMAWNHQQAIIDQLKAQLNNMEQCYIQLKQEHNELIAFNTEIDRKRKVAEKTAEKHKSKVSMIADLLRNPLDREMTIKAITTVIERVGEQ